MQGGSVPEWKETQPTSQTIPACSDGLRVEEKFNERMTEKELRNLEVTSTSPAPWLHSVQTTHPHK